jgi:hypothetical protein
MASVRADHAMARFDEWQFAGSDRRAQIAELFQRGEHLPLDLDVVLRQPERVQLGSKGRWACVIDGIDGLHPGAPPRIQLGVAACCCFSRQPSKKPHSLHALLSA